MSRKVGMVVLFFWIVAVPTVTAAQEEKKGNDESVQLQNQCKALSYAYIKISSHLRKKGFKATDKNEVPARVFINNMEVGVTPFEDCLPEGRYVVELRLSGRNPKRKVIDAMPGESYTPSIDFLLARTARDKKKAETMAKEEAAKKQNERERLLYREWIAAQKAWEKETAPIHEKRKPYILRGTFVLLGGAAVTIVGATLEGKAFNYNHKAEDAYALWMQSSNEDNDSLLDDVNEYEHRRDVSHAVGIPMLAVGIIAIAGAIVVYSKMPRLPDKPKRPSGLKTPKKKVAFNVTPIVSDDGLGALMHVTF